jgi:hypothetical protein
LSTAGQDDANDPKRDSELKTLKRGIASTQALSNKQVQQDVGQFTRQSGGLALRMATPKDYYLVKVDALRNRALLLQVSNGLEEEIVGVDADVAADVWHTPAVRAQDDRFTVYLDGVWIFTGYDKTFPHAGRIALWAEPGSITRFDRITIGPTPKPLLWR